MPVPTTLPPSAAVVIVGGGIIGTATAWHLAARGVTDVVVLDAAPAPGTGDGSTGRATGGYRAQYASAINVQLSLLARATLRDFATLTGVDPGYRPVGYLFLAHDAATLAALAAAQQVQHACGLHEAQLLTPEEAAAINPAVSLDGAVGAAWCPTDGTIRPLAMLRGFREGAERAGVRFAWGTRVTALVRGRDGRITHVVADGTRIACDVVVNAAGAWAAPLAALADVALPVVPTRRHVAVTEPLTALDDGFPMTIWTKDAFHLRVRDGRALLNWPTTPPAARPDALDLHAPWVETTWAIAQARVPALRTARLDPAAHWAGLYEMTPDKTAILDRAPGCDNLLLVNGSSGHGVMHSPALGRLAAELLVDGRATTLDVHPLRLSRFGEGDTHPVSDVL
ncbi:MAG: FAD-binding oxidoreductase [Gemmatimonadaceae bacterium]|nr:FAD-binding oxidoreductase [Gemmatimonadaceae bacterium]